MVSVKNLSNDLDKGRTRHCQCSKVYLINPFHYQKKYQLVDIFKKLDAFHERNAQSKFIRALLHCSTFPKLCNFCREDFSDLLKHQMFDCTGTLTLRKKLEAYLDLYDLPARFTLNLQRTTLTFLEKIDYGENALLSSCETWTWRTATSLCSWMIFFSLVFFLFTFYCGIIEKQLDEVLCTYAHKTVSEEMNILPGIYKTAGS